MSAFKIGDRVRLIDSDYREIDGPTVGSVGTVVDANKLVPIVSWDGFTWRHAEGPEDPTWVAVHASELEVIS